MRPNKETKGVGLVLTCTVEQRPFVLLLKECKSKPELGKLEGMKSFPMETVEPDESLEGCLQRLIREELPGLEDQISRHEHLGRYQVVEGVWLWAYQATCRTRILPDPTRLKGEVEGHYWTPLASAVRLDTLRAGALEPLEDARHQRLGTIRYTCQWPKMLNPLPAAS